MDIGNKIKRLRLNACLTQEQLANKLGVSTQSVSKWETGVTMPDITLLPSIATEFGVTIDEIFDLTVEQKLYRIEKRLDIEEEFSHNTFSEYEEYLKAQLDECKEKEKVLSLLANLYHHRMEADSRKVSKYARECILLSPEKKDCQWLLQKAEGASVWDWNMANHSQIIDFYKKVIETDLGSPKTPMPYYEIMDNLIADHRTEEARKYLNVYKTLPAHKPFLVPIYEAHLALAEYEVQKADEIIVNGLKEFSNESGYLFETAQYYAKRCKYEQAIKYYELSWATDENKKPRYTDALHAISIIYQILGDYKKALQTYDKIIKCLIEEWGYGADDFPVIDAQRQKKKIESKIAK